MRTIAFAAYFIACLILLSSMYAQGPAYKNYSTSDGLPSNNIYSVIQDDEGFIWFATDNGVSRFDGSRFRNFSIEDGLTDRDIIEIVKDNYGRLWFLAFNGKLCFYQNGKIYNGSNNKLLSKINIHSSITALFVDSKKNLWVAYTNHCTLRATETGDVKIFDKVAGSHFWEDKEGRINLVFGGSIFTYQGGNFTTTRFPAIILKRASMLPGDTSLLLLGGKQFTIGKSLKIFLGIYNIRTNKLNIDTIGNYSSPLVESFFIANDNHIWLTSLRGALRLRANEILLGKPFTYDFFTGNSISSIFQDRNNNYWFSSFGAGVFRISSLGTRLYDKNSGLVENDIISVALLPDSAILIGSKNDNIQILKNDIIQNKNNSLVTPSGNLIRIDKDSHGNAWVLTDASLVKYIKEKFYPVPDRGAFYKSLFVGWNDIVWVGFGNGLKKVVNNYVATADSGPLNRVYALEQTHPNELWAGTEKGLYYFKNGKMINVSGDDTLLSGKINALAVSADSSLWIATDDHGLLQKKKDGKIIEYTVMNGLLSNNCNSLLADGNKIYLATSKGLNILTDEKNRMQISSYTSVNGLIGSHVNQIIRKNENIFLLATDKGIIEFDKRAIPEAEIPVPYINEVFVNDISLPLSDLSHLHYNENNLQIDFGVIDFNAFGHNRTFYYKLSGLDTGWNHTTSASVKYNRLPPGNFTFFVKTENHANIPTSSFSIQIETPFWQTWWFKWVFSFIALVIIILLVKYRFDAYGRKINQQRHLAESELRVLRAQINPHFIYNSLNSIQSFIVQNQKGNANLYLSKFATLMRGILSHSLALNISLTEEIESLQLYLELEVFMHNGRFTFNIVVDKQINTEEVQIPSMILQPYIENAILHGLATLEQGGEVNINFSKNGDELVCTITDNGIGRKKAAELRQQKVWKNRPSLGMKITQERIDLLSVQSGRKIGLEITDLADEGNNSQGTRVRIHFPFTTVI